MEKILMVLVLSICFTVPAHAAKVSNFTEISMNSLHGNVRVNKINPADGLYYPWRLNIDGEAISDDGIHREERVYLYFGTAQADIFTTAKEIYNASPVFLKPTLKDLGTALINVDLST